MIEVSVATFLHHLREHVRPIVDGILEMVWIVTTRSQLLVDALDAQFILSGAPVLSDQCALIEEWIIVDGAAVPGFDTVDVDDGLVVNVCEIYFDGFHLAQCL